jgi:propanol-preferring alcohol dehydrogenase
VTRADVRRFLALAAEARLAPEVRPYPLAEANAALVEVAAGEIRGAKVLVP